MSCQALVDGPGPDGRHGPALPAVLLPLCMGSGWETLLPASCSSYREGGLGRGAAQILNGRNSLLGEEAGTEPGLLGAGGPVMPLYSLHLSKVPRLSRNPGRGSVFQEATGQGGGRAPRDAVHSPGLNQVLGA